MITNFNTPNQENEQLLIESNNFKICSPNFYDNKKVLQGYQ